jgi:hypothetical protein
MNHDPRFPLSDEEAYEWSAQERALAEERAGLAPAGGDPSLRTYRLMAHLLAQPPEVQLPPQFARQVARRVRQAGSPVDAGLERGLLVLLLAALSLAGLAAAAAYGALWLPSFGQGPVGAALAEPWIWALAACLGLSRLSRHWWQQHHLPA